MPFRTIDESRTEITELMVPSYANFGGKVHGGYVLSVMDKIAYACATRHAREYCVTASVDTVDFRYPIEVGTMLRMLASVNYVGNSSMEIGIRTETHDIRSSETHHTNTSYFTMVAIGEDGKSKSVPGLILQSHDDVRRFLEGMARRKMKRQYSRARSDLKTTVDIEEALKQLAGEKCEIKLT
ncbi:MAG: acyl-CoA thioesterase [Bacteroidota bacterium]